MKVNHTNSWIYLLGLFFVLCCAALYSCSVGSLETSIGEVVRILIGMVDFTDGKLTEAHEAVVKDVRLPRVLMAVFVGGGLALAGVAMQGLLRNPLADPAVIGISSGAALGGAVAIVLGDELIEFGSLGDSRWLLPLFSVVGAIIATLIVYMVSRKGSRVDVLIMLLAGVAVTAFAGAAIGLMIYLSSDDELRSFTFWTLGSLARAEWNSVSFVAIITILALLIMLRFARPLNAFMLGESEAFHLGFNVEKAKRSLLLITAFTVGATVACCGVISFVGLVIPHIIRLLIGPDHRMLIPSACLLGAIILIFADLLARTLAAPVEIPIGILTSLVGAPFFLYLLIIGRK